jgi:hypothetical protein
MFSTRERLSGVGFLPGVEGCVIPAKAGIQQFGESSGPENWMPACAGMTDQKIRFAPLGGNPARNAASEKNLPL